MFVFFSAICTMGSFANSLELVKQWRPGEGRVYLKECSILVEGGDLKNEEQVLRELFQERGIRVREGCLPIRLQRASVSFGSIQSRYRDRIVDQGYQVRITDEEIVIKSPGAAGVFYGIQTLEKLIKSDFSLPKGDIVDWPDLAARMFMVDLGHQNENREYYKRVIRFCGRHKMNYLHMHLTDNQDLCLYHEEYPSVMHPHALRPQEVSELVALGRKYHVEIIPEIESFGHSEVFIRHPQKEEYLHGAGPKYTKDLCPASEKTYEYLDAMYARTAREFPGPILHVGLDEVHSNPEDCERCRKKWPGISKSEWFLKHLLRCHELVTKHGRRMAMWRDVLISHKDMVDKVPKDILIFEWSYYVDSRNRESRDNKKAVFLQEKGFEVIGCPAIIGAGNKIYPSESRYTNIERYAEMAREIDLLGIDTTTWSCHMYMTDALWLGIAFAGEQSWAGSHWNEIAFCGDFLQDFYGSSEGEMFAGIWKDMIRYMPFTRATSSWGIRQRKRVPEEPSGTYDDVFVVSCWFDQKSLEKAREYAGELGEEFQLQTKLEKLRTVRHQLENIGKTVTRNRTEWDTMEKAVAITVYTLEHLYASRDIYANQRWNIQRVKELDEFCVQTIAWLEQDWDRNRFVEDRSEERIRHYGKNHNIGQLSE